MATGQAERRLTIGQLSDRCRLPVSTLRYYHRIGLLVPAAVDRRNGYRYYDQDQVQTAAMIAELRALRIPPAVIAAVLADPSRAADELAGERRRAAERIERQQRRLERLDHLIAEHEDPPAARPAEPVIAALPVPSGPADTQLEGTVSIDRAIGDTRRLLARLRRRSGRDGSRLAARFPRRLAGRRVPVTVFIDGDTTTALPAADRSAPPQALSLIHFGPYEDLWRTYDRLLESAARHGHEPGPVVVERYLPARPGEDAPSRTEVLLALASTEAGSR